MTPLEPQPPAAPEGRPTVLAPPRPPAYPWLHRIRSFLFITFCVEMGLFLLIFPWTDYWNFNYFSNLLPHMESFWDNLYVRGAISGLGVANLYISFAEILRWKAR
jgi:hypothetical protein